MNKETAIRHLQNLVNIIHEEVGYDAIHPDSMQDVQDAMDYILKELKAEINRETNDKDN